MKKKTAILFVALALVFGAAVGAMAASGNETISALLNREITILYNGTKQTFADANGTTVYPISYNGSTYLPVRAVSNLVGLPINWDGAANTISLGSNEKQPTTVTNLKNSGTTEYNWIITDKAELTVAGSDANQTYSSGIQWSIWNGMYSTGKDRVVYFDVTGYTELTFTAWSDKGNITAKVYDQNYNVITSFELANANSFTTKTITIPAGTTKIAFGADLTRYNGNKDDTAVGNLKILDPIVK